MCPEGDGREAEVSLGMERTSTPAGRMPAAQAGVHCRKDTCPVGEDEVLGRGEGGLGMEGCRWQGAGLPPSAGTSQEGGAGALDQIGQAGAGGVWDQVTLGGLGV